MGFTTTYAQTNATQVNIQVATDESSDGNENSFDISEYHCFEEFGCGRITVTPKDVGCAAVPSGTCDLVTITNTFSSPLQVIPGQLFTPSGEILNFSITNSCTDNVVAANNGKCFLTLVNNEAGVINTKARLELSIVRLAGYAGLSVEINITPPSAPSVQDTPIMFVTSAGVTGDMNYFSGQLVSGADPFERANNICNELAKNAANEVVNGIANSDQYGGNAFKAWISTQPDPASSLNFMQTPPPATNRNANYNVCGDNFVINPTAQVYMPDGTTNIQAFNNTIMPFAVVGFESLGDITNENGVVESGLVAYTNTLANGEPNSTFNNSCNSWTSTSGSPSIYATGLPSNTFQLWTQNSLPGTPPTCAGAANVRIYCFHLADTINGQPGGCQAK